MQAPCKDPIKLRSVGRHYNQCASEDSQSEDDFGMTKDVDPCLGFERHMLDYILVCVQDAVMSRLVTFRTLVGLLSRRVIQNYRNPF